MNTQARGQDKVVRLMAKGVDIPNPSSIDLGEDVDVDRISGTGVRIYPGCRIYGRQTVISAGAQIGYEGPATVDNCRLGPKVELRGGFFHEAVFLEKAGMGSGAHVREGCILEEEANGAHCVGIKQTILFPFVTLGSLINFCDCLMAGGMSRKDHSEVGSSYIHFNYTPDGDKSTPSLIGDVPRGVMLNQPAIFLGGQGGIVGPVRMGFGNVVAANSVLRDDYPEDGNLIVAAAPAPKVVTFKPRAYFHLPRIVGNNIVYMANLKALEEWYVHVRRPFLEAQEFGLQIFSGLLEMLALAKKERVKRLQALAEKAKISVESETERKPEAAGKVEFYEKFADLEALLAGKAGAAAVERRRDDFLSASEQARRGGGEDYIAAVRSFPAAVAEKGVLWLQGIVDATCRKAQALLPSLAMFGGPAKK